MTTWVLVLLFFQRAASVPGFSSKAACEAAAHKVEIDSAWGQMPTWFCVEVK